MAAGRPAARVSLAVPRNGMRVLSWRSGQAMRYRQFAAEFLDIDAGRRIPLQKAFGPRPQ